MLGALVLRITITAGAGGAALEVLVMSRGTKVEVFKRLVLLVYSTVVTPGR